MKKTKKFDSTLNLLYFLAEQELFEVEYQLYQENYSSHSFKWKIQGIEEQILSSNKDFNDTLKQFLFEEVVYNNQDFYDMYAVQPVIIDNELEFKISLWETPSNIMMAGTTESVPFSDYVEKFGENNLLPFLRSQLKTDQLTSANFDDFIKFSTDDYCQIFDQKSKTWLNCNDVENGEAIDKALEDFYDDSVLIDFDEEQSPHVSDNEIIFHPPPMETSDNPREIMAVANLEILEDKMNYALNMEVV